GKVRGFLGPCGVFVRSYAFIRAYGPQLREMSEVAVLNANYLLARLREAYELPFDRLCMHEFVLSARRFKREHGVTALDVAKRLMDYGFHPPTIYFPLIVPEALMIEPTETEAKETLDAFADAMLAAEVGAEQKREDPTVNRLEELAAGLLGQEAAVFLPTATMANEIALRTLGQPGDEVVAEENSHILLAELGGPAVHSGLMI